VAALGRDRRRALFGVLFVLPIGGADMPVVISLLNAFTGLAVAIGGFELENNVLIVAGMLVGASARCSRC
jgi:NAD(P) transhydrogenase subunit beta